MHMVSRPIFSNGREILLALKNVTDRLIIESCFMGNQEAVMIGQISEAASKNYAILAEGSAGLIFEKLYFSLSVVEHIWDENLITDNSRKACLEELELAADLLQYELSNHPTARQSVDLIAHQSLN